MEPTTRRTLLLLSGGYALMWATISMVAGPGSAALVELSGNLSYAGLFIALFSGAAALGGPIGGRFMDRAGRRPTLVAGYLLAAAGYGIAGAAYAQGELLAFAAGVMILAFAFGIVNLTRAAVAGMFIPSERGDAVARLQVNATLGAIVGPLLLVLSGPVGALLGRPPLTLVWFLAPPLLLVAAVLVLRSAEPGVVAGPTGSTGPVPGFGRLIAAGGLALACSQAAMAAVMGVAGAAVAHAGHGVEVLGGLMFLHFVGMFGLSRVVGKVADRAGRRTTILTGLGVLASGGIIVAGVPGIVGFGIGLLLVGLGWSFGFIGASVLLTDVAAPHRRARLIGRADLVSQLAAASVAITGGFWFASRGVLGLGLLAVAIAALPILAMLLVQERSPGLYGPMAIPDAAPETSG